MDMSSFTVNDTIQSCIQEMVYPPPENGANPMLAIISAEDYKAGFETCLKKTSSPSGSHLGHYRTALTSDSICFVYATLISIPFDCGFTLDRWTNALLVMLEKTKEHQV